MDEQVRPDHDVRADGPAALSADERMELAKHATAGLHEFLDRTAGLRRDVLAPAVQIKHRRSTRPAAVALADG